MPTYEIERGDAGFKLTKKTRNERGSDYEYFYFTRWQDVATWLANEMREPDKAGGL